MTVVVEHGRGQVLQNHISEIGRDPLVDDTRIEVEGRIPHIEATHILHPVCQENRECDMVTCDADVAVLPIRKTFGTGCIGRSSVWETSLLNYFAFAVLLACLENVRPRLASFSCTHFCHGMTSFAFDVGKNRGFFSDKSPIRKKARNFPSYRITVSNG